MTKQSLDRVTLTKEQQRLVATMLNMSELEFTRDVLIPMFQALGFSKIDYHGGSGEKGKDLILWSEDKFGRTEVAVAQVKLYKPSRTDADSRSISEIVTQLSQCLRDSIPSTDGSMYPANVVYFITPHPLDTRTLLARFDAFEVLRGGRLTILDGALISETIISKMPQVKASLLGEEETLLRINDDTRGNAALLQALNVKIPRALPELYTDLDFFLDKPSGRVFLRSQFAPCTRRLELRSSAWSRFLRTVLLLEQKVGVKILLQPPEDIEKGFKKEESSFRSWQQESRRAAEKVAQSRKDALQRRTAILDQVEKDRKRDVNIAIGKFEKTFIHSTPSLRPTPPSDVILERLFSLSKIGTLLKRLRPLVAAYVEAFRQQVDDSDLSLQIGQRMAEPPLYRFEITGVPLVATLEDRRRWLRKAVAAFNAKRSTPTDLKKFLLRAFDLFAAVNEALSDQDICASLGISSADASYDENLEYLMSISLHSIFDTGLNICILGEAGAGKTTTLEVYAHRKAQQDVRRVYIFLPMALAVRAFRRIEDVATPAELTARRHQGIAESPELIALLHAYLLQRHVDVSVSYLRSLFSEGNAICLLDGIDECIGEAPWVLDAISRAASMYPKSQFVLSSRMSGDYIRRLPFQCCTLRSFTPNQRKKFIKAWFQSGAEDLSLIIEEHLRLSPALSRVVRNPLLVTLLCTLAENGVPLPSTELRLYEERQRLLLGYYDLAKGVSRVSNPYTDLDRVSCRLALWLHRSHVRHATRSALYEHAVVSFSNRMTDEQVARVVDELIHPCNILVPMTADGQFGFGHLRFQEYLASRELLVDRALDLASIMEDVWWHDILEFYAEASHSIDWLVVSVGGRNSSARQNATLKDMIKKRPNQEARQLRALLQGLSSFDSENLSDVHDQYEHDEDVDS